MNGETREQHKCSLAAEVLQSSGALQLRVKGTSMLPTLWPGDLLTILSSRFDQVEPGDVVLYQHEGRFFVVHRVVSKANATIKDEDRFLIARGDCVQAVDPSVRPVQLLGKVTRIERDGLFFAPRKLSLLRLILARTLCYSNLFQRVVLRLNARRSNSGSHFATEFISAVS
jgi:signal peptidase I